MPKPELDCVIVNVGSGHARANHSWVLSRMLRSFSFWSPGACADEERDKLIELRMASVQTATDCTDVRVGLRVTVWESKPLQGRGHGDVTYWIGLFVSATQLIIAAIPVVVYREWFTLYVTAAGTALAYASGALPQWVEEKLGVGKLKRDQCFILTEGNGAHDALLILGCKDSVDLERLAGPQRSLRHPWTTRVFTIVLAILWIALLLSVGGWSEHTWFIVGVGMVGMLHNFAIAGASRKPGTFGIDLEYRSTFVDRKVMEVLRAVEESYPRAGAAMVPIFFPGRLYPRERLLWEYAERRAMAFETDQARTGPNIGLWRMPPLQSPLGKGDDSDIVQAGFHNQTHIDTRPPPTQVPVASVGARAGQTYNPA
jgi:hypothetical protein